jgi:hypothetical protein
MFMILVILKFINFSWDSYEPFGQLQRTHNIFECVSKIRDNRDIWDQLIESGVAGLEY